MVGEFGEIELVRLLSDSWQGPLGLLDLQVEFNRFTTQFHDRDQRAGMRLLIDASLSPSYKRPWLRRDTSRSSSPPARTLRGAAAAGENDAEPAAEEEGWPGSAPPVPGQLDGAVGQLRHGPRRPHRTYQQDGDGGFAQVSGLLDLVDTEPECCQRDVCAVPQPTIGRGQLGGDLVAVSPTPGRRG